MAWNNTILFNMAFKVFTNCMGKNISSNKDLMFTSTGQKIPYKKIRDWEVGYSLYQAQDSTYYIFWKTSC